MGPTLGGCTPADFVDRSAASASRVVGFGGANGSTTFGYAPRCITISAGQTVTFMGDFSLHPLSPGLSPTMMNAGSAGNPVPRMSTGSAPLVVTFTAAGAYPYFCELHYAGGMLGVVNVR